MRRKTMRATILIGAVALAGLGFGPSPARAQFPIFYGDKVLTPFGNRGSDGSYLTPRTSRRYVAPQPRYYAAPPPRAYYAPAAPRAYYYAPQATRYVRRGRYLYPVR